MADQENPSNGAPLSLEDSSLEEIVDALISARRVVPTSGGDAFSFESEDARTLLRFYKSRPDLWVRSKPIVGKEIEDVLQAFTTPPRVQLVAPSARKTTGATWSLTKVEAHRFAGLHRHCTQTGKAPDLFELQIDRDITCIWGFNGAGKTALQSAIMWCLTGRALRSLHMPDEVHEAIDVEYEVSGDDEDPSDSTSTRKLSIPPIVPLPSSEELAILKDCPALDTWVQLIFSRQDGTTQTVRRSLQAQGRGRPTAKESGLSNLGLSALAIEAGTLMPAVAASMRFDEKTSFSAAISQLTGLKPLADLGRRAVRLEKRLGDEEAEKSIALKSERLSQFRNKLRTLTESWDREKPQFGSTPLIHPPTPADDASRCAVSLSSAKGFLEKIRDTSQADLLTILGTSPVLNTPAHIERFLNELEVAKDAVSASSLAGLPSFPVSKQVAAVSSEDRAAAHRLLTQLAARAVTVANRLRNVTHAARLQLYARVADWHREHHPNAPLLECPVCGTDLESVQPDAILDVGVRVALQSSLSAELDATRGRDDWQKEAARELAETLPESLRVFLDKTPDTSILDLYKKIYVNELLSQPAFSHQLAALRISAHEVWRAAVASNPIPEEISTARVTLPIEFSNTQLGKRFDNIQRVIDLAAHREQSGAQLRVILNAHIGTFSTPPSETSAPASADKLPLRRQIVTLHKAIESSTPVLSLLRQVSELEQTLKEWEAADTRHALLVKASSAAAHLRRLPDLVHQQVAGLINTLEAKTEAWLHILYKPHYIGGPAYRGIDPAREHGVGLNAGLGELKVAAHHVMNSSQLRACTWAFLFSLWEHIRLNAGGLDIFLLDDPQTHFDPVNVENFASAIPQLVSCGMAPIITSNDSRFIAAIRDKLPRLSTTTPSWTTLQINPISSSRLTASLCPSIEEVFERRDAWADDQNNVAKAQNFVERVRLHIENCLWDLLASDPAILYKPTLAELVALLARARAAGELPFNEEPFGRLLSNKALRSTSHFYISINKAHHNLRDITPHDAEAINQLFDEVNRSIRSCSASYARFMGRLSLDDQDFYYGQSPAAPAAVAVADKVFPIIGGFSARTNSDALAVEGSTDTFALSSLGEVALFSVRGGSLGTLALQGQIVIASLTREAESGDPVIALNGTRVLARRYHGSQTNLAHIALSCDLSGGENVAPALMLRRSATRLLPIIGVLYDKLGRCGDDEGSPVSTCRLLERNLLVARIIDDSAYPVVRNGDFVLLENISALNLRGLKGMYGEMVAILASQHGESYAYLKRVGDVIGDALMIFNNIGSTGNALPILVSEPTAIVTSELLKLEKIWQVHGVIRRQT